VFDGLFYINIPHSIKLKHKPYVTFHVIFHWLELYLAPVSNQNSKQFDYQPYAMQIGGP